jgi:sarcosine oxidase, subunit alpha
LKKRILKASIYCEEPIPCNPCETACPFGAITVGEDITALPRLDSAACRGCGICLAVCPGLAIRLLEEVQKQKHTDDGSDKRIVAIPYEYPDIPEPGDIIPVCTMEGVKAGIGRVTKVWAPLKDDPTMLVYLEVPAGIADIVWGIYRPGRECNG